MDELLRLQRGYRSITHCLREANKPADRLSKLGADSGESVVYDSFVDLPRLVRGDVTLDRWGCPSFRRGRYKG